MTQDPAQRPTDHTVAFGEEPPRRRRQEIDERPGVADVRPSVAEGAGELPPLASQEIDTTPLKQRFQGSEG